MEDIEVIKAKAQIEAQKVESQTSSKEVASKYIGKSAVPWIVLLVIVGVVSAAFMPSESLPAVIGLVSTAVMALIGMLTGITGTKDKEEKPEFTIINDLVARLDKSEPLIVEIKGDKVTVSKGANTITSAKEEDSK
jgi:cadmium resistance protein CadD (predicted permease)